MSDESLRRVALVLHGLAPDDRDWILQSLSGTTRARLEELVTELDELGLPSDPELVRLALAHPVESAVPLHPQDIDRRLTRADPRDLRICLEGEPAALIAVLLHAADWPWRDELVTSLPAPQRDAVLESLANPPPGNALTAAVLRAVSSRLSAQGATEPSAPAPGAVRRTWWASFASWATA